MKLSFVGWGMVFCVFCFNTSKSQISSFPYVEHFDSVIAPALPSGWTSTTNRLSTGDFISSASSPHSTPQCLYSQNSTISQSIVSPAFDFTNRTPDKLQFYISRSTTHTSGLLIEASVDGGMTFPIALSDTIKNPGNTEYVLTSLALAASLVNQNRVKIRWRIIGGTGGTTGTFRLDDVTLTSLISYDLAAAGLLVQPTAATSRDSLTIAAKAKNFGIQSATNYTVDFFCDENNNSILEPSERFASVAGIPIAPSDSATIIAGHSPLKAGDYKFFSVVSFSGDEAAANDTASTLVSVGYPKGSVLVNEFMYAPAGDEPEWVELLNCSNDSVNLRNWRISDNNVMSKSVIASSNLVLPPEGFCIVAKDASFASYHPSVSCPVLVASFSALNNTTPDAVVIYEQRLISMDSVSYSPNWGGQGGKSLERIDVDQASVDPKNWGTSLDSGGCTPGKANSIVRLEHDLSVGPCWQTHSESNAGLTSVINCTVQNLGKGPVSLYDVKFYSDSDRNGAGDSDELITTITSSGPLNQSDSTHVSCDWPSIPQGESVVLAVVVYPLDERPGNNCSSGTFSTCYSARCVVVNEIMFDPLANQNEWIELYNRGSYVVDLRNWKFKDRPTASGNVNSFSIASQPILLRHGEFAILAADSTIFSLYPDLTHPTAGCHVIVLNVSGGFSLGNDGDDIILTDLTGTTIDSVSYSPRWHRPDVTDTKGRSLEKINPDLDSNSPYNWTTCVLSSGGTPGKSNSTYTSVPQRVSNLTFSPNPFSPDGDGHEDFCLVQYHLPLTTAHIQIKIFDIKGRLVRTLANSQISASSGEIVWDGMNEYRQRVRIGPYIVLIQATDPNGNALTVLKGVVVVAAKM